MTNTNKKPLVNKTPKAPNESKAVSAIKAFANNGQHRTTVKYRDYSGNKKSRSVTLGDPGIATATKAIDLMRHGNNTADFVDLFQLIMDKVIVSPQLSFAKESKSLGKTLKTKTTNHKNKNGVDVSLNYQWPGYRQAVQIVTEAERTNGAMNMTGILNDLNAYVFKDDSGRAVKNDYWDAGGHAYGLGMKAINEAIVYLSNVLDHDGFGSIIQKGLSFLTEQLR